eukprot:578849-Pelagomonas_calceolata.AAC.1
MLQLLLLLLLILANRAFPQPARFPRLMLYEVPHHGCHSETPTLAAAHSGPVLIEPQQDSRMEP